MVLLNCAVKCTGTLFSGPPVCNASQAEGEGSKARSTEAAVGPATAS